jgi:hypothetical protein
MQEFARTLRDPNMPIPERNTQPTIVIRNAANAEVA